jgi:hypothetical protein
METCFHFGKIRQDSLIFAQMIQPVNKQCLRSPTLLFNDNLAQLELSKLFQNISSYLKSPSDIFPKQLLHTKNSRDGEKKIFQKKNFLSSDEYFLKVY